MDYVLYYTAPNGDTGSVGFSVGGTYDSVEDFVDEFLFDHEGYTVIQVVEE